MMYMAISVPVRPSPARQCTERMPVDFSARRKNMSTIASVGVEQSVNMRLMC